MLIWIITLLFAVLAIGGMAAAMMYLRKTVTGSLGKEKAELQTQIDEVTSKLELYLQYVDDFGSKKQFESLAQMQESVKAELEQAKKVLGDTEEKLETAQTTVDEKEGQQQELKSASEDEESKLDELAGAFESISQESIDLERELADSLKELDAIMDELEMTQVQRDIMQSLSNALEASSARMRDLIFEYQQVNERLEQLKAQHLDLEDEYTKLVEQQLGG